MSEFLYHWLLVVVSFLIGLVTAFLIAMNKKRKR